MIRSYKVRIYPTKEQEILMNKHIDCCRFIWNYMLALNLEREKVGLHPLSGYKMCNELTLLKRQPQYTWLNEVSRASLAVTCNDLGEAYKRFLIKLTINLNSRKRQRLRELSRLGVMRLILKMGASLFCLLLAKSNIKQILNSRME